MCVCVSVHICIYMQLACFFPRAVINVALFLFIALASNGNQYIALVRNICVADRNRILTGDESGNCRAKLENIQSQRLASAVKNRRVLGNYVENVS